VNPETERGRERESKQLFWQGTEQSKEGCYGQLDETGGQSSLPFLGTNRNKVKPSAGGKTEQKPLAKAWGFSGNRNARGWFQGAVASCVGKLATEQRNNRNRNTKKTEYLTPRGD